MRVIIANPPWPVRGNYGVRATSRWPHLRKDKSLPFPIFHAYAAAILEKAGVEVIGLDAVDREMDIETFSSEVARLNPDFVFIETSVPSYRYDRETIKAIKEKTKTVVVVFGPQSSAQGEFILRDCPETDIAVRGEYDYTFLDIVNSKDWHEVLGITFREGDNLVSTPSRPLIADLDTIPFPARHLYPLSSYQEFFYDKPNFLVSTSRGCSYGCSFCLWPQTLYGHRFRFRSVENIVEEIEFLIERYCARSINFDDDTFTLKPSRIVQFCEEILKRGLKFLWYCYSSTNINDVELYRLMKKAGCVVVRFGVETADNEVLKRANKHLTVEQIIKGFESAKKAGLRTFGTFTFCLPGETRQTIEKTIELSKKLNPFALQYSYVVPFPGTKLYEEAKNKGWLNEEVLYGGFGGSQRPVLIPEGMSEEELVELVKRAHRGFYLRLTYMVKVLSEIRNYQDLRRLVRGLFSILKRFVF